MIVIYITCLGEEEARKISKHLLDKHLIACANMFPVRSMYLWKGKINDGAEFAIIAKTKKENFDAVQKEVKKLHSYDVPCIECWNVEDVNKEYRDWVEKETK